MTYLNKVVLLTNMNKESGTATVCDVEADHNVLSLSALNTLLIIQDTS